jgi:hypothetical protein
MSIPTVRSRKKIAAAGKADTAPGKAEMAPGTADQTSGERKLFDKKIKLIVC